MSKFILQVEDRGGWIDSGKQCKSFDDCYAKAGELFDETGDYYFRACEIDETTGQSWGYMISGHSLMKKECPICCKTQRTYEMYQTCDCHGIPYRLVCGDCFDKIMNEKGYDGEHYTEADECLDEYY